jgi:hypothetical protein
MWGTDFTEYCTRKGFFLRQNDFAVMVMLRHEASLWGIAFAQDYTRKGFFLRQNDCWISNPLGVELFSVMPTWSSTE